MEKLKHHSIIISLILYFGISLLIAEMAYLGISHCIDQNMINLLNPKPDSLILQGNTQITLFHDASDYEAEPSITNPNLFQLLKIVKSILPAALFGLCILLAAIIFYKRKLKKQIDLLQYGMDKVSKQDLDFKLHCDSRDEIGMLCNSFEHMREELQNTFEKLWNAEEKQNLLLRAFSHDLRTPLTILKGNNDLIRHILGNENSKENIYNSLTLNDDAIKRIERYTEALKNYKNIDQWELINTSVNLNDLKENLIHQCQLWDTQFSKKTEVLCDTDGVCYFDPILIQLVLDRIIENA
ncbi:MAG TPA: HAMP domain-containing protein, partial [Lachnospiraceae bacterium]|nr:HAMP domain-containing protein [Lachnospiraceae bacterium]